MIGDPFFYLCAIPAVLLFGISKGGFGGSIAILGVPLLTLVISPTQAAAILLPILCVMDIVVVWTYRGRFDRASLRVLLPGAMVGILLGYFFAGFMHDHALRILIGGISILFVIQSWIKTSSAHNHNRIRGALLGLASGFTSFAIHAGGPPFSMYMLPKKLEPLLFAGTAGLFFAIVNYVKLVPYFALGQLNSENLLLSLILMPLAPLGVGVGYWLVKRTQTTLFYYIAYFFLFLVGVKLLTDGLVGLVQ